jgi:hypothetical protein
MNDNSIPQCDAARKRVAEQSPRLEPAGKWLRLGDAANEALRELRLRMDAQATSKPETRL